MSTSRPLLAFLLLTAGVASAQFNRSQTAESDRDSTPSLQPINVGSPQQQSPFQGSVTTGQTTAEPLRLTVSEAIDRGLKNNLGLILTGQGGEAARAARLRSLSDLLPKVNGRVAETAQQINLAAFGFPVPAGQSPIIGPFSVFDARATASQRLFDLKSINDLRASDENVRAAKFSYDDARELVTLVVANEYLLALAAQARVSAAQAQLDTAETLFTQTQDLKRSGVVAGIDVLRSQVQFQTRQQRLIALKNEAEKAKLQLGRAIGLPSAQQIVLADSMPEAPMPPVTLDGALQFARDNRADLKQAKSLVHASELRKRAQQSQYIPSARLDGDYGVLGRRLGDSHGTFTAAATLNIPIFNGGRYRADVRQADVELQQRKAQLSDLEARVEQEVRQAFMDVESATAQVAVAKSAVGLAHQQLTQARDRFAAGVAGSLDVVESEQVVTEADENLISALYQSNIAKATLARATGRAEQAVKQFLGAK